MKFAPEYVTYVLNENFEDAKALLLSPLMAINYAHLVMLADAGDRLAPRMRTRFATALDGVSQDEIRAGHLRRHLRGSVLLRRAPGRSQACGDDVAGRLHTARSRNDIDMTMYRMRQRELILGLAGGDARAARGRCSISPTATATRSSPRTRTRSARSRRTVAHYLLAVIEQLERDAARLKAAFESTNRNPLGACAITGTGFPIDRSLHHRRCSASADRPATPTAASRPSTTCSRARRRPRCCWSASAASSRTCCCGAPTEFGYLRLGDGFVQGSSIMPQKRNPVALEHARAIGSKALGQAQAIVTDRRTTRRSATSSTPRTICSRSCSRCSATRRAR